MGARTGATDIEVRAAANLASAADEFTASISCFGCGLVSWAITQTDADVLAACVVQLSNDPTGTTDAASTWQDARNNIGTLTNTADAIATAANAGGSRALLWAAGGSNAVAHGIPWKKARLKLTGHAANQIDGLSVVATVFNLCG